MVAMALLLVFPAAMAFAAASDLVTMTIPNSLSLILIAAFLLLAVMIGISWEDVAWHIGAGFSVLAVCFGMFFMGWMGGGDAKLAASTALWLGFGTLFDYLMIAAVAGGVLTLIIIQFRFFDLPSFTAGWTWLERLHDKGKGVPYGIALAAAALFVFPHSAIWTRTIGL